MKLLLILLTFCLGFVACIPQVIFIGPAPIPKSYQSGHVLLPYNEIGPPKIPNILRSGRSGPKLLRRNRRNTAPAYFPAPSYHRGNKNLDVVFPNIVPALE